MALGDLTEIYPDVWAMELAASTIATTAYPTTSTQGVNLADLWTKFGGYPPEVIEVGVISTAGSGTMDVTCQLVLGYGTLASAYQWSPGGTGSHTTPTAGVLNDGAAIGECSANKICHFEPVYDIEGALRAYGRVTAINGTDTAVTMFLIGRRRYGAR